MQIPREMVDRIDHGVSNVKQVYMNVILFLESVKKLSLISDVVVFAGSAF